MKKKILGLLIPLLTLALSGCNFFDMIVYGPTEISTNPPISYVSRESSFEDGTYEKAKMDYMYSDLNHNSIYKVDAMPSIGEPKILVVPLWFNDSSNCISQTEKALIPSMLDKAFFGTNEDTGWYSVSSYFEAESYGKCKIGGEVLDWQNVNMDAATIDINDKDGTNPTIGNLVKTSVDNWKRDNPNKAKEFDSDHNGYLDAVVLIYGYYDNSTIKDKYRSFPGINNDNLWAFTYWLQNKADPANVEDPVPNTYMFTSYDFMYNTVNRNIIIDTHTYIHETGHMFGLEDYYDYSELTQVAGKFSMQDYNVGGHDPYSMMALGWVEPYIPHGNNTISINKFESSGDCILLPTNNSYSTFDEYILIELYSPTGVNRADSIESYRSKYQKGPTQSGIRIWHVDARLLSHTTSSAKYSENDITNTIVEGKKYRNLNTNNTYIGTNADNCSPIASYRDRRLLELIRLNDFYGTRKGEAISNENMFKFNDSFVSSNYIGYFGNGRGNFNNGCSTKYTVKVLSLTDTQATIEVTVN